MNDIIQYVKESNKIKENFEPSVSTFNGDRVFLSNNYVIKLFDEKSSLYYKNELFAYENMSKEHVAEMIEAGEHSNVNYILMKRIKGKSLYCIWDDLKETEKKKIISQISNILKEINSLKVDKQINFKESLRNEYKTWFEKLKVNEQLKSEIDKSFNKNIQYIDENEKNFWCYFDNHFDNYIYDGKRVYIIDFEDLRKGPIDYQLDVWNRMSKYPTLFANEIESKHIKSENYKNITKLLSKNYPEIYANKHIKQRLQLYSLLYDIRIIVKYNLKDHVLIKRLNEDMYGDRMETCGSDIMRKKFISKTYLRDVNKYELKMWVDNNECYIVAKKIIDISEPFIVSDGRCLIDNGYYIIEVIPIKENYTMRVFFNDKKERLEYYFDITKGNGMDETSNIPYYDDLYLDITVRGEKISILDEDELSEALNNKQITNEEYNLAIATKDKLIESIKNKSNQYMNMNLERYLN